MALHRNCGRRSPIVTRKPAPVDRNWSGFARKERRTYFDSLPAANDDRFSAWLKAGYAGIFNYPTVTPLMVHHLPGYLATPSGEGHHGRRPHSCYSTVSPSSNGSPIKEELRKQAFNRNLRGGRAIGVGSVHHTRLTAGGILGKVPRYFAESIHQTDRDEARLAPVLGDRGTSSEVGFVSMSGDLGTTRRWRIWIWRSPGASDHRDEGGQDHARDAARLHWHGGSGADLGRRRIRQRLL